MKLILSVAALLSVAAGANAQVHHFLVTDTAGGPPGPVAAGAPLWIQVLAVDSVNATVTSFTGTVALSSDSGMAAGFGATPSFTAGALSAHQVVFSSRGTYTIRAVRSGGTEAGASAPVVVTDPVLSAKVILQGPFNGTAMSTLLSSGGLMPLAQPFKGAPWNYAGNESVAAAPAGVVDWILVEARTSTAAGTTVARRAALLRADGTIADTGMTGSGGVRLRVPAGSYHIVIRHRNHTGLMSATPRPLNAATDSCDLTSAPSVFGGGAVVLTGATVGMRAGDYSADGFIDVTDFAGPVNEIFNAGYRRADLNLDGFIDGADFVHPDNNVSTGSTVPE